jgi:hypothetical protein
MPRIWLIRRRRSAACSGVSGGGNGAGSMRGLGDSGALSADKGSTPSGAEVDDLDELLRLQ